MKKYLMGVLLFMAVIWVIFLLTRTDYPENPPVTEPTPAAPAPPVAVEAPSPFRVEPETEAAKLVLENELAAARRELTELRMKAASEVSKKAEVTKEEEPASFMDAFASMMDSPDMQEAMEVQQRMALDWETQDALIRVMADARKASTDGNALEALSGSSGMPGPEMMDESMRRMDSIRASYLESAADILDEEQLAVFQESLEQYSAMQKAGMEMAKSMFGSQEESEESEEPEEEALVSKMRKP